MYKKSMGLFLFSIFSMHAAQYTEKEFELYKNIKNIVGIVGSILKEKNKWGDLILHESPGYFNQSGLTLEQDNQCKLRIVSPFGEFNISHQTYDGHPRPCRPYGCDRPLNLDELAKDLISERFKFEEPQTAQIWVGGTVQDPYKVRYERVNGLWPVAKIGDFEPAKYAMLVIGGDYLARCDVNREKLKAMAERYDKEKAAKK